MIDNCCRRTKNRFWQITWKAFWMFLKSGICQSQDNANGPNIATMSEVQDGKHRMDHDSFCVAVDISSGEHRQLFFPRGWKFWFLLLPLCQIRILYWPLNQSGQPEHWKETSTPTSIWTFLGFLIYAGPVKIFPPCGTFTCYVLNTDGKQDRLFLVLLRARKKKTTRCSWCEK